MSKLHFTTKHANAATVQRQWFVVDGTNQTVGRMCARIAAVLRGKHKASFTPHFDAGDFVIVINAEAVALTGNKGAGNALIPASESFVSFSLRIISCSLKCWLIAVY